MIAFSRLTERMPILAVLIALFLPRILIAFLWFLTPWFNGVFNGILIPLLGFLLMPYTMLWYSAVTQWYSGQWGVFQIIVLIIAIAADLGVGFSSRK